jgi:zinc transport system ATP-binding protein
VLYISCEDLSFAYEGLTVIRNINFSVQGGDYLCVLGENGSGKSTLIKGILGLKETAEGRIVKRDLKPFEIGYLPQERQAWNDFPAGVFEVVLSGRLGLRGIRPFYTRADKLIAEENLIRFEIGNIRNRCYRELSGGQRQRVLLARALTAGAKLLILDEPGAGLDPLVSVELYRLLEQLNREMKMSIIMVSHDVSGAVTHASHILHLKKEQTFFGTTAEYLRSPWAAGFFRESRESTEVS